jgi:hypothetical protein
MDDERAQEIIRQHDEYEARFRRASAIALVLIVSALMAAVVVASRRMFW